MPFGLIWPLTVTLEVVMFVAPRVVAVGGLCAPARVVKVASRPKFVPNELVATTR